jgi:hypothetical protein
VVDVTVPKKIEFIPFSPAINVENIPKSSGCNYIIIKPFLVVLKTSLATK